MILNSRFGSWNQLDSTYFFNIYLIKIDTYKIKNQSNIKVIRKKIKPNQVILSN